MSCNEDASSSGRAVRESEIFREPPGSGNFSSSIGAAAGIELFRGGGRAKRARLSKTITEPQRDVPVLDRMKLGAGSRFEGPAVVTQLDATTLVAPGWSACVHASGAMLLQREGSVADAQI